MKRIAGSGKRWDWRFLYYGKLYTKKSPSPQLTMSAKTVIRMRDQGFEPWTP